MTRPTTKENIQPEVRALAINGTTCPSCGSDLVVIVGPYVSREQCLSCGQTSSLAWTTWRTEPVFLSSESGGLARSLPRTGVPGTASG